jgi:hypothetical protein
MTAGRKGGSTTSRASSAEDKVGTECVTGPHVSSDVPYTLHVNEADRCELSDHISYDEWVRHVFDHPVLEEPWWSHVAASGYRQEWNESADTARTLSYLTQLFEEPSGLIGRFTSGQIDQGLYYLVSNSCSDHMFALTDTKLSWAARRRCFDAILPLYKKLMAPVYGDQLGHTMLVANDSARANSACYMWWDLIPLYGGMEHSDRDRINDAVLGIFNKVLKLKAESCLESALHGLGHWHAYIPGRTGPIVRRFLARMDISRELRDYAERVAVGSVP